MHTIVGLNNFNSFERCPSAVHLLLARPSQPLVALPVLGWHGLLQQLQP